jgi:hypothetical protein
VPGCWVARREVLAPAVVLAVFLAIWAVLFLFQAVVLGEGLRGGVGLLVMSVVLVAGQRILATLRRRRRREPRQRAPSP